MYRGNVVKDWDPNAGYRKSKGNETWDTRQINIQYFGGGIYLTESNELRSCCVCLKIRQNLQIYLQNIFDCLN